MLTNYIDLITRSFTEAFKKSEYKRYWKVPVSERLVKVGLPAGLASMAVFILLSLIQNDAVAIIVSAVFLIFIVLPLIQNQVDKLKNKYSK